MPVKTRSMSAAADTQHESKPLVFKYSHRYDLGYHIPTGNPQPSAEEYRLKQELKKLQS